MGISFISLEDSRMRIHNTVCEYKGKPVMVYVDDPSGEPNLIRVLTFKDMANGMRGETINVGEPSFNYKSLPLGYMDYQNTAIYVMRVPARQNHAGIHKDWLETHPKTRTDYFWSQSCFEKCLLGKHMRADRAIKKVVEERATSVPIHRHVAVGKVDNYRIGLYYRTRLVGLLENGNRFNLFSGQDRSFVERIIMRMRLGIEI